MAHRSALRHISLLAEGPSKSLRNLIQLLSVELVRLRDVVLLSRVVLCDVGSV